jgi:hypothetical protein
MEIVNANAVHMWCDEDEHGDTVYLVAARGADGREIERIYESDDECKAEREAREAAYDRGVSLYVEGKLMQPAPAPVPDGDYYLFPEGGLWEYQEWRGGRCVSSTDCSEIDTYTAMGHSFGGCDPGLATEDVDDGVWIAIVGPVLSPESVAVRRVPD